MITMPSPDLNLIENHPSLLKTVPAYPPPPNVQPNFENPYSRLPVILGVSIPLLLLAISCFCTRIYTKVKILRDWKWDDITCGLGLMFSIVYFAAFVMGCVDGAVCKHIWDIHLDKIFNKHAIEQSYISVVLMTPPLGLIKCSFFIQYYELFHPFRWVRVFVIIGATISTIFFTTITIIVFVLSTPRHGETLTEAAVTKQFFNFNTMSLLAGIFGVLVDWSLLILPIPAVLALKMSISKKVGVLIIFMTGSLAAVASIVSLHVRGQLENNIRLNTDPFWKESDLLLWAEVEMFAGITASCMPTVHKLFSHHNFSLASLISSWKSSPRPFSGNSARGKLSDDVLGFHNREGRGKPGSRADESVLQLMELARPQKLQVRNGSVEESQLADSYFSRGSIDGR